MIANVIAAMGVVLLFAALLHATRLVALTREAISVSRQAAAVMRDPALTDDDKEREVQRGTLALFRLLFLLLLGTAVALLVPLALLWLAGGMGWVGFDATMALFVRWDFLLAATAVGVAAYLVTVRWSRARS